MRILWFTNTPSNYKQTTSPTGGGWISSLETEITRDIDISLGIAFFHPDDCFKSTQNKVAYYPIRRNMSYITKADRFFRIAAQDEKEIALYLRVIEDFKPDIIHVFGTESSFGLLSAHTQIPVVIHLQGLMNPCVNAWLPPGYDLFDYFTSSGFRADRILLKTRAWFFNKHAAKREKQIMSRCRYFIGRTGWDKNYVSLYAPKATYYHCDEILRNVFYEPALRTAPLKPRFVSILSSPLYKGHDVILKTAKVLIESGHTDFEWDVYGIQSMRFAEKKTKIKANDVNVRCKGIASAEELKTALLNCTVYIHPSYIDNSPNSLCEAQITATPAIVCNVGGVASLIDHNKTGFLVPANDPLALAATVHGLITQRNEYTQKAQDVALARHDPETITKNLFAIYKKVLDA